MLQTHYPKVSQVEIWTFSEHSLESLVFQLWWRSRRRSEVRVLTFRAGWTLQIPLSSIRDRPQIPKYACKASEKAFKPWSASSLVQTAEHLQPITTLKELEKMLAFEWISLNFQHYFKKSIKIMYSITEITIRGTHHMIVLPMFSKDQNNNAFCRLQNIEKKRIYIIKEFFSFIFNCVFMVLSAPRAFQILSIPFTTEL